MTLGMASAATVGLVVAGRRPRHPVGWLLLALGLTVAGNGVSYGSANDGLLARPGSLLSARWRWWARLCTRALVLGLLSWALEPFEGPSSRSPTRWPFPPWPARCRQARR
jgi:hypothetical protein